MMETILMQIGAVAAFACGLMLVLWFVQRAIRDAGVVDVGWSFSLGASAAIVALLADGDPGRRVLIAVLAGIWGTRLALHLLTDRVLKGEEDGRYQDLRESIGPEKIQRFFFVFYQAQAVSVVVLALPFFLIVNDPRPFPGVLDYVGVGLWLVGVGGESLADWQLRKFKKDPDAKGRTCRVGLWRYSRHPNYFFEWIIWVSYAVLALAAPLGWLGVLSPLIILFLVLKVTGIPPTEKRAIKSRGEDYRRYQQETSAFFPWFPKKPAEPLDADGTPATERS